jgi:hypothetical protein
MKSGTLTLVPKVEPPKLQLVGGSTKPPKIPAAPPAAPQYDDAA